MIYSDYLEWLKIFQGRKFVEFDWFSKKRKYRHIIVDDYHMQCILQLCREIYLFKTYCLREGNIISIKNFCRCRNNMRNKQWDLSYNYVYLDQCLENVNKNTNFDGLLEACSLRLNCLSFRLNCVSFLKQSPFAK